MQFSALAFAFLSLVLSSQGLTTLYESSDSCEISVNSTTFNLCPLQNIYFNASLPLLGQLSFSVIGNIVPNCANSGYIWGANYDWARHCNDIALSNPTYINIEPNPNGGYGGLNITFPLQVSPTTGMAYQVGIVLSCSYSESDSDLDFSVTSLVTGNVTNYAITADTPYGCGIPPSCTPSSLNGAYYNLCDLQTIIFNVTNQFGLQIALTLGQNALLTCPGDISPVLAIVIDKSGKCYKFNPMSGIEPLSPQINYKNGIQMDLYEQSLSDNGKLSSFELTLNCDPNQDPSDIAANVTSIQSTSDSGVTILLTGASPYACPEN